MESDLLELLVHEGAELSPIAARTRSRPSVNHRIGNAAHGRLVEHSEPVAARTRARMNAIYRQNRATTAAAETGRARAQQQRNLIRRRALRNNIRNNEENRNRISRGQIGFRGHGRGGRNARRPREEAQHLVEGFFLHHNYLHEHIPDFLFSDHSSSLDSSLYSHQNSGNNSSQFIEPLELSTVEVSDPLTAFKCAICLDQYIGRRPVTTKCGHIYCHPCIGEWLRMSNVCPKCKKTVTRQSLIRVFP